MCVARVVTGAAGVKLSLFKSGSSSDFRRRGLPVRPPDGEVGLEELGDMWVRCGGMGRRRLGLRDDEACCCC